MGIKKLCRLFTKTPPDFKLEGVLPNWSGHPSWIMAVESLGAYTRWVDEVILPIAFQWVEEHKAEVYADISDENKDDVGVVMASAFRLIQKLSAYEKGSESYKEFEKAMADGTWDPSQVNPVWAKVAQQMRASAKKSFEEAGKALGETSAPSLKLVSEEYTEVKKVSGDRH